LLCTCMKQAFASCPLIVSGYLQASTMTHLPTSGSFHRDPVPACSMIPWRRILVLTPKSPWEHWSSTALNAAISWSFQTVNCQRCQKPTLVFSFPSATEHDGPCGACVSPIWTSLGPAQGLLPWEYPFYFCLQLFSSPCD
jgi:ribosomal protein S27E